MKVTKYVILKNPQNQMANKNTGKKVSFSFQLRNHRGSLVIINNKVRSNSKSV